MSELNVIDSSIKLFSIDKKVITFQINQDEKTITDINIAIVIRFKIFRDMLVFEDPKMKARQFEPVILGTPTKIKDGNYSYYIQRKVLTGKHGKNNDAGSIEARMQRGH